MDNIFDLISRDIARINYAYEDFAKKENINYTILAIITTIYNSNGATQKEISQNWILPKQTVNSSCQSLIEKGYLTTRKSNHDKREKYLIFTNKGINFAKPIVSKLNNIEDKVLEIVGKEKIMQYYNINNLVSNTFEEVIKNEQL